ncbi:MAG: ferric reductase-like transmembrane domain-containing protein [Devosiaceae bacterium]|nr:ferric reductase-like transmembrane domain-containing protein [Devosiaceae bacterium]
MEKTSRFKNLMGFGWKTRHLVAIILAVAGTYGFLELRAQWSEMHRWNRAIGDMSFVMVALSMATGPLSRLIPAFRKLIPFRRELGIYGIILAAIHTMIILIGWVNWDFWRLFGFELHPAGVYVMVQQGFGMANVIGIIALVYGLVLALSSSNWSQRLLGASVWKFLQQSAYVLWMLIVIHTAYFLYFHFLDYHKNTPEPNALQIPFAIMVSTIMLLQLAAFLKTWKLRRNRVMSDQTPITD